MSMHSGYVWMEQRTSLKTWLYTAPLIMQMDVNVWREPWPPVMTNYRVTKKKEKKKNCVSQFCLAIMWVIVSLGVVGRCGTAPDGRTRDRRWSQRRWAIVHCPALNWSLHPSCVQINHILLLFLKYLFLVLARPSAAHLGPKSRIAALITLSVITHIRLSQCRLFHSSESSPDGNIFTFNIPSL